MLLRWGRVGADEVAVLEPVAVACEREDFGVLDEPAPSLGGGGHQLRRRLLPGHQRRRRVVIRGCRDLMRDRTIRRWRRSLMTGSPGCRCWSTCGWATTPSPA